MTSMHLLATAGLLAIGGVSASQAQVLGGQLGGTLGGTVGGVGQAGAAVDGSARIDPALPDARPVVDGTTRTLRRTARDRKAVHVDAGASLRVSRGSRCYYDDYYYDPVYRDGSYYCERSGTAVGAGVQAGVDARAGR